MTLPPLPLVNGALLIDNTFLELFQGCGRKCEYARLFGRIPSGERSALNFGSGLHKCLEHRYRKYGGKQPDYDIHEEMTQILHDHYELHPCPIDDWRNMNWACELIKRYNDLYAIESFNVISATADMAGPDGKLIVKAGQPLVEMPFMLPLFTWKGRLFDGTNRTDPWLEVTIPVYYTGRIDLPIMEDDQIYVMDHKTSSMLGEQFFKRGRLSAQQRGYVWAFQELTGRKVAGYVINALRSKEPPASLSTKSSTEVNKWWRESFARERYYLDENDIAEWKVNVHHLVNEFFWHYQQGYYPMRTTACTMFGTCEYYDVCTLPKEQRGLMLQSGLFTDNVWSPLNRD